MAHLVLLLRDCTTHEPLLWFDRRVARLLQLEIVEQRNYDHYVMNICNSRDDEHISNLDLEASIYQ